MADIRVKDGRIIRATYCLVRGFGFVAWWPEPGQRLNGGRPTPDDGLDPGVGFQPGNFRFCPACGELTASKGSDLYRLAGLSAEGRSSATTVLVASILKWMNDKRSGTTTN
jgi:hypothetical protein